MAHRVLIAGFMHETNTFSGLPTSLDSFRARDLHYGDDVKKVGAVLAKRDAWARIAGCMREEAGSVVGSVIV